MAEEEITLRVTRGTRFVDAKATSLREVPEWAKLAARALDDEHVAEGKAIAALLEENETSPEFFERFRRYTEAASVYD
jgi:hypothetical protein